MAKNESLLERRVTKILPSKEGLLKLLKKKKIRVYLGIDPTATRLHLGHTLGLRKLMDFANAGHETILLFGTGTVLVGDPSQRDTGRKLITQEEIDKNIATWKGQVSKIIDLSKIKILQNGDWLTKLNLRDIINIASKISAVQLFKREMFQRRLKQGDTVWYHETMYPLLQGYDSVVMDVDLEIGGTDQEFNMLIGRELQKKINQREKYVLTFPMIMGTDGKQMSKTSENCVWLDDDADEMFGKLMSLPDNQIVSYMQNVTDIPSSRIDEVKSALSKNKLNPLDAKKELALAIITQFHSQEEAKKAQDQFEKTFQKRKSPEDLASIVKVGDITLLDLVAMKIDSKSEAKRLLSQGAVDVNGKTVKDPSYPIKGGETVKIGKKIFVKVKRKK